MNRNKTTNPLIQQTTEGLETTKWGTIVANNETGVATVISAMGAGKTAAKSIHEYIQKKKTGQ